MTIQRIRACLLVCSLVLVSQPRLGIAQTNSATAEAALQRTLRDGQRDFDFEIGTWKTHLLRRLHPLTGSTTWVEYDGTSVVRKIWDGRANLMELEVDGPKGHIEALSLRLYNPQSHQWSINAANSRDGILSVPTVGEFKDGRGEFFDQEPFNGRTILVRNVWSDITPNSCRFEQSFSDDGGKTWETNWIATDTRVKDDSAQGTAQRTSDAAQTSEKQAPAERDGQHDFDFELGAWNIHLKRLLDRLAGSTRWVEFDGTSVTRKVWDGRSQLEEFETDSNAGGHIEGLTLRLYNPQSHQWSLYWSNSKNGTIEPPQIGEFKNGRGEFFGRDTWNGKAIFVRFIWSDTDSHLPHFEQSFSADGGKTWEVNWITDQTRVQGEADKAH